ncbi:MAG: amidohydrolase [Gammaproteobacteria bacterium]|nr:amidohydrolase [Gammaproteobacteria bacterium]
MIIDCHHHLLAENWYKKSLLKDIATNILGPLVKDRLTEDEYNNPEIFYERVYQNVFDETGDLLVKNMKEAGVDKTCIFSFDAELTRGVAEVSIDEQNEKIAVAASKYPEKLIPFYSINPRQNKAVERFKYGLRNLGMKGIKLHPPLGGFLPSDDICYPIYRACMEHGVPVIFHTGSLQPIPSSDIAHPSHVEKVALDFPRLPIILAHFSLTSWEDALRLASKYSNLYFDFSLLFLTYLENPTEAYRRLRKFLDEIGPERVFWGTDGPFYNDIFPTKRWVKTIKSPDPSIYANITFSNKEIDLIMGNAFANLLNIV